jgi:hypothetical protein
MKKLLLFVIFIFILSFYVVAAPPSIDIIPSPQNLTEGEIYTYTVSVTDGVVPLTFSDNTANFEIDSSTGEISFTPTSSMIDGFVAVIIVMDANLDVDAQAVNFSVNAIPNFANIADKNVTGGDQFYFDINATDYEDGTLVNYTDDSALFVINVTEGEINFTTAVGDVGTYTVNISANDTIGGVNSSTFQFYINDIPNMSAVPNNVSTEDVVFLINISEYVNDVVGSLNFSDDSEYFDINDTTGIISFTPNSSMVGNNSINLSVIDEFGLFNWTNWTLEIVSVNDAPIFDDIPNQTIRNGRWFTYDVNATDEEGDTIYYNDDSALFMINVSTGLMNLSVNEGNLGSYNINVSVNDSNGDFTYKVFTLNLTSNRPPQFFKNLTVNITPSHDNYVDSLYPSTTYSGTEFFEVSDISTSIKRTYMNFSLESIPNTSNILAAWVNLTINSSALGSELTLFLVNNTWSSSSLDYDDQPGINESVMVNRTSADNENLDIFNVLDIVERWFNSTEDNYGFSLRMSDESGDASLIKYYSSDFSNGTKWPRLYVIYNSTLPNRNINSGESDLNILDLDDYFYDLDGDDLTFSVSSSINVTIDSGNVISIYSEGFSGSSDSVVFNASDGINSSLSNTMTITIISASTPPSSSSSGGGGGSSRTKLASLSIQIDSSRQVVTVGELLQIPVVLENIGQVVLNDIDLGAIADKLGLDVSLNRGYIDRLNVGDSVDVTLVIDSKDAIGDSYIVTLNANSDYPNLNESTIFVLDVLSEGDSAKEQLEVARDLFKNNPECLELQEMLDDAEDMISRGNYEDARRNVDIAIESCKNMIKNQEFYLRNPGVSVLGIVLVGLTVFSVVVIIVFNLVKRVKINWK